MEDFHVVLNTDRQLDIIKVATIHNPSGIVLIGAAVLLAVLLFLVPLGKPRNIRFFFHVAAVIVPVVMVALVLFSHEIKLDKDSGTATVHHSWAGIAYSTTETPLSNLKRVEQESDNGQRRLVLLLNDGGTMYPFGIVYGSLPNQYNIQDAINTFLGHS